MNDRNDSDVGMIEMKEWFKSKEEMSISFKLYQRYNIRIKG